MSNRFQNTTPDYICTCPSRNQVTVPSATHHPSDKTCRSPICSKLTGFNDGMLASYQQTQRKIDLVKEMLYQQSLELFDRMIQISTLQNPSSMFVPPNKAIGASAKFLKNRIIHRKPSPKLEKTVGKPKHPGPARDFREVLPPSYMDGDTYVSGIETSYGQRGF